MSYTFTDLPHFVSPDEYDKAIGRMLDRLKAIPGLVSVYQVGGISTPGISDIDLFAVFEENVKVNHNPLSGLTGTDKYLFTHNLFGTSESYLGNLEQFTYFGTYQLLFGRKQNFENAFMNPTEEKVVKKQIALEYLMKAFITSTIEQCYHSVKLRNLFLHVKALKMDMDFLGINSGALHSSILEILRERNNWFEHHPDKKNLSDLVHRFNSALHDLLKEILMSKKLFLVPDANLNISKNITLKPSEEFSFNREGFLLPKALTKSHSKIPKLLNRMNKFIFQLPVHQQEIPDVVVKRHNYISEMINYREIYLPYFIPTAYGLNIFSDSSL